MRGGASNFRNFQVAHGAVTKDGAFVASETKLLDHAAGIVLNSDNHDCIRLCLDDLGSLAGEVAVLRVEGFTGNDFNVVVLGILNEHIAGICAVVILRVEHSNVMPTLVDAELKKRGVGALGITNGAEQIRPTLLEPAHRQAGADFGDFCIFDDLAGGVDVAGMKRTNDADDVIFLNQTRNVFFHFLGAPPQVLARIVAFNATNCQSCCIVFAFFQFFHEKIV